MLDLREHHLEWVLQTESLSTLTQAREQCLMEDKLSPQHTEYSFAFLAHQCVPTFLLSSLAAGAIIDLS